MTWEKSAREKYGSESDACATEITDAQWEIIEPYLPGESKFGRPRKWQMREIFDAIFYMLKTSCQWRSLPTAYPPWQTVSNYFYRWRDLGLLATINHHLVMADREAHGKEASPTAGCVDAQTVKVHAVAGPRGYDGGKKINGRKRHVAVDTLGNLLGVIVTPADTQDRDGIVPLLQGIRSRWPWMRHVFVDTAYNGPAVAAIPAESGGYTLEISARPPTAKGFVPVKKRWVVERTFGWLSRCRRLTRDFEATIESAEAWIYLASIRLMLRRIAHG